METELNSKEHWTVYPKICNKAKKKWTLNFKKC